MLNTTEKITYCNGFRRNGDPADIETIRPIFDERRSVAFNAWVQYQQDSRNHSTRSVAKSVRAH